MYMTSKKITNNDAKNIISGQDLILVDDSSIDAYTDSTNYYNSGVYGWNYSIGYSTRLDKYVICGYRIPQSVLHAANSVIKMAQKEASDVYKRQFKGGDFMTISTHKKLEAALNHLKNVMVIVWIVNTVTHISTAIITTYILLQLVLMAF